MTMLRKVEKAIKEEKLLVRGDCVIVAVSGGPDSMALLKCLELLADKFSIKLVAAHVNHGIRGDKSDREEKFIRNYCQSIGISFECKKIPVPRLQEGSGKSIEEVGREERYRFFEHVAHQCGASRIAIGHHLHDQVETVIMNFLRGSGTEGLKGMLPLRDGMFIRPLLSVNKSQIMNFLKKNNIPYMIDDSNTETRYLRNKIRHSLIPELKRQFNPNLDESLAGMSEIMRFENDYIKKEAIKVLKDFATIPQDREIKINVSILLNLHPAIQNRVIKLILERISPSGQGIGRLHIKSVTHLAKGNQPGGTISLPFNIRVVRKYDWLHFMKQKRQKVEIAEDLHYEVSVPDTIHLRHLDKSITFGLVERPEINRMKSRNTVIYLDYEKIIPPLTLRTMKPGDRIQPSGMTGTKKLKSYFIDKKIPRDERSNIPILVDGESVVCVLGMRSSERVMITEKSRKILRVEIV
jgi:tRNA(Ile)-lysidine synthase